MVSFGRICCVGLPFVLAVISIISLMVAGLAGVADKKMYMFQVNTTNLSVSASSVLSLITTRDGTGLAPVLEKKSSSTVATTVASGSNVTASDLGLGKLYDFSLWGYCETQQSGTRNCTKAAFNYAAKLFNDSEAQFTSMATAAGVNMTLPTEVKTALKVFSTLSKWTQVAFLIAYGCLALEILTGLFTSCSRGISCLTFLVAGITGFIVTAAAGMATALSLVVVGAVDTTAKWYGVTAHAHTGFLAAVWIGAAAALGASFFWMFTVCCCKPDSRRRSHGDSNSRNLDDKSVPLRPNSYQPLHDPRDASAYYNHNAYAPQYGAPRQTGGRADLAYEPYSHSRV